MATTTNPKKKKKGFERGSVKQLKGNTTSDTKNEDSLATIVDGEVITMEKDLISMSEINENDPHIKKWLLEKEAKWRKRSSHRTREEADQIFAQKLAESKKST